MTSSVAAPLAFARLTTPDELESIARWDDLVRAMPRPSPFLLKGWLVEWWRHYLVGGARPAVIVGTRGGRVVAAAPIFVERRRGIRVAEFLGRDESSLADLLIGPSEPSEVPGALLDELRHERFDYAALYGAPRGSFLEQSGRFRVVERAEAPVLDLSEGWDVVYNERTSSKRRSQHRRRLRQLGELGPVEFTVARESDELERALDVAFALHALRWRGRPDGSTFGTEAGRAFHRAALRRLADADVARILLMRIGGRPAAFHYYLALDGTMFSHRLGFDPALARYSPGLMATLESLGAAANEGLVRVEFLGGSERYKTELADMNEPITHSIGLARTPLGVVGSMSELELIRARRTLKRSERLHRLYLRGSQRGEDAAGISDGAG
jgi:CelD/BcsL family acetyltransferase involved in cellulose biosynthesis